MLIKFKGSTASRDIPYHIALFMLAENAIKSNE